MVKNRLRQVLICHCLLFVATATFAADPPDAIGANDWIAQGPGPAYLGQVEGITNREVIGAIHAIAAHPSNADILYIGAVNGGVWKTTNATNASPAWTPMTDTQTSLSIGALEFDPTDGTNQTLVAGIGRYSSFSGNGGLRTGLLKTTNGGTNWGVLDGGLAGKNISGLAPRGATIVVSVNNSDTNNACSFGIFRSTDGGTNFIQMTPAVGTIPRGVAFDLASDRSSNSTLYTAFIFASECTGSVLTNGVYRSTDTGATWTKVSNAAMDALIMNTPGVPFTSNVEITADGQDVFVNIINDGRPAGIFYTSNGTTTWTAMDLPRTPEGSAVPIAAPGSLIPGTPIAIDTTNIGAHGLTHGMEVNVSGVGGTTGANGIWKITKVSDTMFTLNGTGDANAWTADTGTWTKVVGLNPGLKPGSQGGNHASIVSNPAAPGTVYLGGDRQDYPFPNYLTAFDYSGRLFRGDPAVAATGAIPSPQWKHLTHSDTVAGIPGGGTANDSAPHADSREMVFDANGNLLESDDGGIYRRTTPTSNTGDWFSIIGNLQVTEQHDIAYDSVSGIIISGNQDTGTTQQQTPGGLVWNSVSTADGGDVSVDDITTAGFSARFSSFQNLGGFRRRVYNPANALQSQVFPTLTVTAPDEPIIYPFVTPVELNALTPTRLVIAGCNAIYESFDQGDTLKQIPGLFDTMCGTPGGIAVNTMAYGGVSGAVNNPEVLYVGSGVKIYARTTAAPAPLVLLATYPADAGPVVDIVVDPDEWKTVFTIEATKVRISTDTGASWTDITGNLTDTNLHSAAFIPGTPDVLLVGGRKGVFYLDLSLLPGTVVWNPYGTGLPKAPVWDLAYDATDDVLVAGTLGRGAWKISTVSLVGPEFQSDPSPDTPRAFGSQAINTESSAMTVKVDNLGDSNLTLACLITGANPAEFILKACSTPVAAGNFTNIQVTCKPGSLGAKSASLDVTTNDTDEPAASYPLTCTGIEPPAEELIFEDGFEEPAL